MSGKTAINLATVGTAELEAMSVQVFNASLETMSGGAIARFRTMRKLSKDHRQALEKYLVDHPEKRSGGDAGVPPAFDAKPTSPAPSGKARRSPFPEIKRRLRAWWEGVDVDDLALLDAARAKGGDKGETKGEKPAPKKTDAAPSGAKGDSGPAEPANERVEIVQKLWGEGFSLPGGETFLLNLIKTTNFPAGHPCLDVAPGLGGGMRAIARARKLTVEGIERDPLFAMTGGTISDRLGMTKEAPIRCGDPETETLTEGRYAAVFARETLYCYADRKPFLSAVSRALVDGGSLIFTDFVLADRLNKDETLANWRAAEPRKPVPATREDYSDLLRELRYQTKVFDDLTAQYVSLIQAGWHQLHSYLQSAKLPPETATMLIEEGNLWLARSRALESGSLKLIYVHALMHKAPKRALSDAMTIE